MGSIFRTMSLLAISLALVLFQAIDSAPTGTHTHFDTDISPNVNNDDKKSININNDNNVELNVNDKDNWGEGQRGEERSSSLSGGAATDDGDDRNTSITASTGGAQVETESPSTINKFGGSGKIFAPDEERNQLEQSEPKNRPDKATISQDSLEEKDDLDAVVSTTVRTRKMKIKRTTTQPPSSTTSTFTTTTEAITTDITTSELPSAASSPASGHQKPKKKIKKKIIPKKSETGISLESSSTTILPLNETVSEGTTFPSTVPSTSTTDEPETTSPTTSTTTTIATPQQTEATTTAVVITEKEPSGMSSSTPRYLMSTTEQTTELLSTSEASSVEKSRKKFKKKQKVNKSENIVFLVSSSTELSTSREAEITTEATVLSTTTSNSGTSSFGPVLKSSTFSTTSDSPTSTTTTTTTLETFETSASPKVPESTTVTTSEITQITETVPISTTRAHSEPIDGGLAFVTQTPVEVSSQFHHSTGESNQLTSTTVFEDRFSTSTTEFITSSTQETKHNENLNVEEVMEEKPTEKVEIETSPPTTATSTAASPSTTISTSTYEPHVDGIDVENIEPESKASDDDFLVVEIEESVPEVSTIAPKIIIDEESVPKSTAEIPVAPKSTSTTTEAVDSVGEASVPKLNDELFYPIERDEGELEQEQEQGVSSKSDDGSDDGNDDDEKLTVNRDRDGDSNGDVDAEIFPAIPSSPDQRGRDFSESSIMKEKEEIVLVATTTTTTLEPSLSSVTIPTRRKNDTTPPSSRDSDTFFYISNTEVKVIESVEPTRESPHNKEALSFPEIYEEDVFIDFPNQNHSNRSLAADQLSHESIVLSPVSLINTNSNTNTNSNSFDPLKFITYTNDRREEVKILQEKQEDPEVENVSFISVEETTEEFSVEDEFKFLRKDNQRPISSFEEVIDDEDDPKMPDVIIQPYPQLLEPENETPLTIGVPIIAELPPQIQLTPIQLEENLPKKPLTYDHFDIDERNYDAATTASSSTSKKSKKKKPNFKKKVQKKYKEEDEFSEFVFENSGNFLVKNPSISLEVPSPPDLNLTKSQFRMNFTNETVFAQEPETEAGGLSDLQTLFLAGFATLLPLVMLVLLVICVRYLWRKYRRDRTTMNGIIGDNSSDPLAAKSRTISTDELKSTESGYLNRSSDTLESDQYGGGNGVATILGGNSAKLNHTGANGSVITMTLKNNHLIVETEERNDISRDARETKMHYSPSEKDGVFVVEVARGADSSMNYHHSEQILQPQNLSDMHLLNNIVETKSIMDQVIPNGVANNQQVQVHEPPPNIKPDLSLDGGTGRNGGPPQKSNTGLSQSDLSLSSSNGSNQNYNYGSQGSYTVDSKGYKACSPKKPLPVPHSASEIEIKAKPNHPVVTGMIYKQDTIDIEPRLQSDIDLVNSEKEKLHNGDETNRLWAQVNGTTSSDNNCDSLIDLPAPPSSEEIEANSKLEMPGELNMDSLPPPPLDEPHDSAKVLENCLVQS